ncbi:farnesol dehydrogenase-like [Diabrotica undecimpunctata]|uniref:farnesol dehydrogenase-like n=1 Tax=Diabrotica undecimpunctata TaxID=50387 RepID=UPI003B6412D7
MKGWQGKIAIVTGASSGIGAGIVEKLVEEGLTVVGLARRVDMMDQLKKKLTEKSGKFYPLECDLSLESNILTCFDYVSKNLGPIYVLINNAGCLTKQNLCEGTTEVWKKVIDVNLLGLCIATREAIKSMKENEIDGQIIHINSITGHWNIRIDGLNIYPATKYAITSLAQTLRKELSKTKTKIKVTSLSPGLVNTEIFAVGGMTNYADSLIQEEVPALSPRDIADAVTYILSTPPHVNISELIIQPVNEDL